MKNFSNGFGLIVGVLLTALLSLFVAVAVEDPTVWVPLFITLLIGGLVPRAGAGALRADASPDISAMVAYAGKFSKKLYRGFITDLAIFKDVTAWWGLKFKENLHKLTVNGQPRPYTGVFEANAGDIAFSGQTIEAEKFQRDILIEPSIYRTTYLGEMRGKGEGANNTTIPFAQFTLETVAKRVGEDINNNTVWNGVGKAGFTAFNAGSTYAVGDYVSFSNGVNTHYYRVVTATLAAESPATHPAKFENVDSLAICLGLGTKIRSLRTADELAHVEVTGSMLTDTYSKAKKIYRGLPEKVRTAGRVTMYYSLSVHEALLDSFEGDISKYTDKDLKLVTLPTSDGNCILKPASWMSGSEQVVCTPKDNLIAGTDLLSDFNDFRTIPQMYTVQLGLTGTLGFGVQDPEAISTNDVD